MTSPRPHPTCAGAPICAPESAQPPCSHRVGGRDLRAHHLGAWYLLPQVNRFKEPIAEAVGEAIGCRVEIGALVPLGYALAAVVFKKRRSLQARRGNGQRHAFASSRSRGKHLLAKPVGRAALSQPDGCRRLAHRAALSQYVYDIAGFKLDLTPADQKGKDASDASIASSGVVRCQQERQRPFLASLTGAFEHHRLGRRLPRPHRSRR